MNTTSKAAARPAIPQDDMNRQNALNRAFRLGQASARATDVTAILSKFLLIFGGDSEALVQFNAGAAFARRLSSPTAVATPSPGI